MSTDGRTSSTRDDGVGDQAIRVMRSLAIQPLVQSLADAAYELHRLDEIRSRLPKRARHYARVIESIQRTALRDLQALANRLSDPRLADILEDVLKAKTDRPLEFADIPQDEIRLLRRCGFTDEELLILSRAMRSRSASLDRKKLLAVLGVAIRQLKTATPPRWQTHAGGADATGDLVHGVVKTLLGCVMVGWDLLLYGAATSQGQIDTASTEGPKASVLAGIDVANDGIQAVRAVDINWRSVVDLKFPSFNLQFPWRKEPKIEEPIVVTDDVHVRWR